MALRKVGLALLVAACVLLSRSDPDPSALPQRLGFDFIHRLAANPGTPGDVAVIVAIDEQSLAKQGRWPWPRHRLATLIDEVVALGPAAIALDIIMPEAEQGLLQNLPPTTPSNFAELSRMLKQFPPSDEVLAASLARFPSVVPRVAIPDSSRGRKIDKELIISALTIEAPARFDHISQFERVLLNIDAFERAAAGHGLINAFPDADGVTRRVPLFMAHGDTLLPSFALELFRVAVSANWYSLKVEDQQLQLNVGPATIPVSADAQIRLHFGHSAQQRYVSANAVLNRTIEPDRLRNKAVIIAVTGIGTKDVVATPIQRTFNGPEVHIQVLEHLAQQHPGLRRPPMTGIWEGVLLLSLGLGCLYAGKRFGPAARYLAGIASIGFFALVAYFALSQYQYLFDMTRPALALGFILSVVSSFELTRARKQRRRLHDELQQRLGELNAAREIQQRMLPATSDQSLSDAIDIGAFLRPAREVGGDFYDYLMLDQHRLLFLLGDVSGKGLPASICMVVSKVLIDHVARHRDLDLNELVIAANAAISRENPEQLFVTLAAGTLDLRSDELELVVAGHEAPLVTTANATPLALEVDGGLPLCFDEDFPYQSERFTLAPGSYLLVYSDGAVDAENLAGEQFGRERLALSFGHAVTQGKDRAARALIEQIVADIDEHSSGAQQTDDTTILLIRRLICKDLVSEQ